MRVFVPNLNPQAFDRGHGVTVSTEMSVMLEFSHSGSRPLSLWSPKMETFGWIYARVDGEEERRAETTSAPESDGAGASCSSSSSTFTLTFTRPGLKEIRTSFSPEGCVIFTMRLFYFPLRLETAP